jgi:hypothetical protein
VPDDLLVGFVGYANAVRAQLEPTKDHDTIRAASRRAARGRAAPPPATRWTLRSIRLEARSSQGRPSPAAIVLLSDGKTTQAQIRFRRLRAPQSSGSPSTPSRSALPGAW